MYVVNVIILVYCFVIQVWIHAKITDARMEDNAQLSPDHVANIIAYARRVSTVVSARTVSITSAFYTTYILSFLKVYFIYTK